MIQHGWSVISSDGEHVGEETTASAQELAASAHELATTAATLEQLVAGFKTTS
jgi:methyl-accepting chemotaxis protein